MPWPFDRLFRRQTTEAPQETAEEKAAQLESARFTVSLGDVEVSVPWDKLHIGVQDEILEKAIDWSSVTTEEKDRITTRAFGFNALHAEQDIDWLTAQYFIIQDGQTPRYSHDAVDVGWLDLTLDQQRAVLTKYVDWRELEDRRDGMIADAIRKHTLNHQSSRTEETKAFWDASAPPQDQPIGPAASHSEDQGHSEPLSAPATSLDPDLDAIVTELEAGWQADLARHKEALAIHRDIDASGLSAAERLVRDHETAGGVTLTYRYWVPEGSDLAQGPASAIEFRAIDADNAADRLIDFQLPETNGVLVDERGQAHQFDGESFQPIEGRELPALSDYERLLAAAARRPANDNDKGIDR